MGFAAAIEFTFFAGAVFAAPASLYVGHPQVLESRGPDSPYSVFGRLYDSENKIFLTATFLSPCYVLTARHAIRTTAAAERRKDTWSFKFGAGPPSDTSDFEFVVDAAPVGFGRYEYGANNEENVLEDWMVLRLRECTAKYGHARLFPAKLETVHYYQFTFEKAGYSRTVSPRNGVAVDKSCEPTTLLVGTRKGDSEDVEMSPLWIHDCSAIKGDSGGALFLSPGSHKPDLVCLITNSPDPDPLGVPIAVPYDPRNPETRNLCVPVIAFASKVRLLLGDDAAK
jgi:hypothetical protein